MVTEIRNKHNHAGDALASERRTVRNAAHRIAAENPSLPSRRIVAQSTSSVSDALRTVGLGENLAKMIRSRRQVIRVEPPVPTGWKFDIPEMFLTNDRFYTVHAQSRQSFKPCVQFLMTQRTIPYYDYAFMKLKEVQPQCSPTSITMDYEQAVITSIQR
uniref:MULE transposase domain-containing protein n=1 Tax=Panagrolaimus davidi TaxID=227884 RepID=A0A914QFU1_9BILA